MSEIGKSAWWIAIGITLLLAFACKEAAEAPPTASPQAEASSAKPTPATPPPAEPVAVDLAAGKTDYGSYCASCHGPEGAGDGALAATLNPKPARHSDGAYMNSLSDEHLFKVIKFGGAAVGKSPMMVPMNGMLSDQQIRNLVAFVRSLADPPYEP